MDKKQEKQEKKEQEEEKVVETKQEEKKDTINEEVVHLQEKISDCEAKYRRALADYQNLEKRSIEEKKNWVQLANKELLMRILPGVDMLFLAAKHVKDQGLDMSLKQFLDVLEQEGLKKIDTQGKTFDPHLMECIQTVEGEDNKVIEEVKSGYMLYDIVIRPAQVVVGKKKQE